MPTQWSFSREHCDHWGCDVGLVSAACFSEFGWTVTRVDKDRSNIEQLRQGQLPIYEPRLDELLQRNLTWGESASRANFQTPSARQIWSYSLLEHRGNKGRRHADLRFVFQAQDLGPHLDGFTVIATKPTVPRPEADFAICSNPEFLRQDSAIYAFTHPDRVLVGCDEPRARELMERLCKPLALRNAGVSTDNLAEIGNLVDEADLHRKEVAAYFASSADSRDVQQVATAIGADGRIGIKFLHQGPGHGGSCFPKDVAALIRRHARRTHPCR